MASPTTRSLQELRDRGYSAWVVEHFNYFTKQRKDLFGFIDVLAIKKDETLAVQTTSRGNIQARIKKIVENEYYELVKEAGWIIEVHGWGKMVIGKYKNGNNKKGWVNKVIIL
jgi:hypothetical protein